MNDHIRGEDLAAYLDGRLGADKKNELESHFSCCPACLDELVEITVVSRGREKIPAHLLKLALGEKGTAAKPQMHLRPVFEIAAVFVVVVFVGYLFVSNNRFWQTRAGQKPSVMTDKNVSPAEPDARFRDREIALLPEQGRGRDEAMKTKSDLHETAAVQAPADLTVPQKRRNTIADKGLAAGVGQSAVIFAPESKPQEGAEEQRQQSDEKENALKKEPLRTATAPGAVGGVHMELAAKDKPVAGALEETFATAPPLRIRIEGEADLNDLRNPELLAAWTWWQNDLILELQIDASGSVTAAVPLGKVDPLLGKQGENEAKKLLFSVSEKKLRRARLVADEKPPVPNGL